MGQSAAGASRERMLQIWGYRPLIHLAGLSPQGPEQQWATAALTDLVGHMGSQETGPSIQMTLLFIWAAGGEHSLTLRCLQRRPCLLAAWHHPLLPAQLPYLQRLLWVNHLLDLRLWLCQQLWTSMH